MQSSIEPSLYLQLSKMNVAIAEIAKLRGFENPWQAYGDPVVQEAFYPAWLDAHGVGLDEAQIAALRRHVHDTSGKKEAPADERFHATLARELEEKLEEESNLASFLRPEQLGRYFESIGDDVMAMAHADRSTHRSTTQDGLVEAVLADWKKAFELSARSLDAAQPVARKYALEASALPLVDVSLDTGARRAAGTKRVIALARAQDRAERELAALTVLTDEERAKVKEGSRVLLDLQIRK